jgi:adenosine deaminase CECR1
MTDEFYVALIEFNLSWSELKLLSENSLKYAFVDQVTKENMLKVYRERIRLFEEKARSSGSAGFNQNSAPRRGFICTKYNICSL